MSIRGDLPLLVEVLRHPVRGWVGWRTMAVELFRQGGMTLDTPASRRADLIGARTLIQPDGDVVVIVDDVSLLDDDLLRRHRQLVGAWYERSKTTMRQVEVSLRALIFAVAAVVAVASGWFTSGVVDGILRLPIGAAVSRVVFPVLRLAARNLVYGLVRRRMDTWVGSIGTAG